MMGVGILEVLYVASTENETILSELYLILEDEDEE